MTGSGSVIAGNHVFLSARYLNINGLVQSGIDHWNVTLGDAVATKISALITKWKNAGRPHIAKSSDLLDYQLTGDPKTDLTGTIASYFNPETNQIVLDTAVVEGGYAELYGQIMNTGGGRIKVMDGFGRIEVTNNTNYDIVVNDLDSGNNIHGVLKITDTARKDASGNATTTVFERTDTDSSRTRTYNPVSGLRYVWTRGQDETDQWIGYYDRSSIGWGIIPTNTTSYDKFEQIPSSDITPLPDGEYANAAGQTHNYEYTFNNYPTKVDADGNRIKEFAGREQWTTYNDWLHFSKTYHVRDKWISGSQDVHTHSLKADHPIDIEFIGHDMGDVDASGNSLVGINVTNTGTGSILLDGSITNRAGKAIIKAAKASIVQTQDEAVISGRNIQLEAKTGIGHGISATDATPVSVRLVGDTGSLTATATAGDVVLKGDQGDMRVGSVQAAGNVILDSAGNIVQANGGDAAAILGKRIDLVAKNGGIGTAGQALNVQEGSGDKDGLNVTSLNDINIRKPNGDFQLIHVESLGGDVTITAENGTLIDANPEEQKDTRTWAQLEALWNDMQLMGEGAKVSSEATIKARQQFEQSEYQKYWRMRDVQPVRDDTGAITGYAATPYDPTNPDAEYQRLNAAYGGGSYDPNWAYVLTDAEKVELTSGSAWHEDELKYGLGGGLLFKETTSTQVYYEDPNVVGDNVTLLAENESIGTDDGFVTIDGSKPDKMTETQRVILAAAEPDDIQINNDTKQITVFKRQSVDVNADGEVIANAQDHVYLGSRTPINVKTVTTGDSIRIKGKQGIYDVSTSGPAAIQSGAIILEGGDEGIGQDGTPLTVALNPGSTVTARAGKDIYIRETQGDLHVAEMYSQGDIILRALGSIFGKRGARSRALQAVNIDLTAENGSIGTSAAALGFMLNNVSGQIRAQATKAGQGIFLTSPQGIVNVGKVTADSEVVINNDGSELNLQDAVRANNLVQLTSAGTISDTDSGSVSATSLSTDSHGGQTLNGANTVDTITATNYEGGDIDLVNTGAMLEVAAISLTSTGKIEESGTGRILNGSLQTTSHGRVDLQGPNTIWRLAATNGGGEDILVANTGATLVLGDVHQVDGGDIVVNNTGSIDVSGAVDTVDTVSMTFSGDMVESGGGRVLNATLLKTISHGGVDLQGANTIAKLSATNYSGGTIDIVNTAATLKLTTVHQVDGGDITIDNKGSIDVTGTVDTVGTTSLTSTGDIMETGAGRIQNAALLQIAGHGRVDLQGANTVAKLKGTNAGGGTIELANTASTLDLGDVRQVDGGDVTIGNTGSVNITGTVDTVDTLSLTSTGDIVESGTGRVVNGSLQTTTHGTLDLGGANTIGRLEATNHGGGTIDLANTNGTLVLGDVQQVDGGTSR